MHPASPQPWTLFWPRSGEIPEPGTPSCPVTSDRLRSECALWMPLVCWVIPMPQIRQEPANGGRAYQRAAWAMSAAGTPVIASARSSVNSARDARQSSKPSVRARDEVEIRQALVEDDAGHRVEQRDVGARARLDEEIGLVAQLHALGVDDDDPRAAGHGPPEADGDDRMIG